MKQKILIVDDEFLIRHLLKKIFDSDYEVFCAENGAQALEIFRAQSISLIISDQRMPYMTGVQLFDEIARTDPQTIRILLSAYIDKSDLKYADEKKLIHKFVAKPWNNSELQTIVTDAMQLYNTNSFAQI